MAPFQVDGIVSPPYFVGREKELQVVYFNCREITTKEGFARKFIETVLEEYGIKHAIKGYIENVKGI